MSHIYKKTEAEILSGIGTIGATEKEYVGLVQDLGVCAAEHGIMKRDGTLLEKVILAVSGRFHTCIREWACITGVPFVYKDKRVRFSWDKAKAIAAQAGHADWKPDTDKPSAVDIGILEKVCQRALGRLEGIMWNAQLKADGSATRKANKADPDKIRKRLTAALEDAKEHNVDLTDLLPTNEINEEMDENLQKLAKMLEPFGDNKEAITVVMTAIGLALNDLKNKGKDTSKAA